MDAQKNEAMQLWLEAEAKSAKLKWKFVAALLRDEPDAEQLILQLHACRVAEMELLDSLRARVIASEPTVASATFSPE
ncbi:hypothetical protein ACNI65_06490 [Roseateles sp. So40a]|uniref:hypothetical protein n=1 Tax=Roseateles sp. So40a TaxID=3400226 RepID=UPI003A88BBAA